MTPALRAQLLAAMPGLKERAKTLVDLIDGANFLLPTGRSRWTTKPRRCSTPEARDAAARRRRRSSPRSSRGRPRRPKRAVRGFAEERGAKLGAVAQPLRAALTGRTTSPGIFEVLDGARQGGKPGAACRSGGAARGAAGRRVTPYVSCTNFAPFGPSAYVTGYYLAVHTRLRYGNNAGSNPPPAAASVDTAARGLA